MLGLDGLWSYKFCKAGYLTRITPWVKNDMKGFVESSLGAHT